MVKRKMFLCMLWSVCASLSVNCLCYDAFCCTEDNSAKLQPCLCA